MKRYNNTVVNQFDLPTDGNAGADRPITVRNASTGALASLFSDNGVTATTNPIITDSFGNYGFYVADGVYNIRIDESEPSEQLIPNETIIEVVDLNYPDVATMAASSPDAGKAINLPRYYASGDLVAGLRYIVKTSAQAASDGDVADGYVNHACANGNVAVLIHSGIINSRLAGCDPAIDNTSQLQALENVQGWVVDPSDEFDFSDTLTHTNRHIDIQGKLIYTGTQDRTALDVNGGASSSADTIRNCFYRLHVESQSQSDWSDENYIGIRLTNIRRSDVIINSSKLFTVGVVARGKGHGFVYNEVTLYELTNNKFDLILSEEEGDASATGFVNENNWYGGNFLCTTVNTSISRYGVVIQTDDTYQNNNNVFHKPSFEKAGTTVTGGAEAVPVVIESGTRNIIRDARVEGGSSGGVLMRCTGDAQGNIFELGYMNATVGDAGPWQVKGLDNQATKVNFVYNRSLPELATSFVYNDIPLLFSEYDSTDQSVRGGLLLKQSGSATDYYHLNGYTINDADVSFGSSRAVGIKIEINDNQEFAVSRSVGTSAGRILIQCYDSSDVLLDDSNGDLVVNLTNNSISYTSIYGGGWRYNSDNSEDQVFIVDSTVSYVIVLFVGVQDLKSFNVNVRQAGKAAKLVNQFGSSVYESRLSTQAPDSGSYTRGYTIYNDTPSASGTFAWVATADIADASVDNSAFKTISVNA